MNGMPPSRIVKDCLGNGVPVILVNKPMPGFAVDTVVTDQGVALLLGKSVRERTQAMVEIAHPDFRAELRDAARRMFWP